MLNYKHAVTVIIAVLTAPAIWSQTTIPNGAKIFVAPMNGYETYIKAAIKKKKLPVVIVEQRDSADFELSGAAESQKAGAAKILLTGSWHSTETASIKLTDIKTSVVAFAYSVNKSNSAHGKQSSAEACAKHLNDAIDHKSK